MEHSILSKPLINNQTIQPMPNEKSWTEEDKLKNKDNKVSIATSRLLIYFEFQFIDL